MAECKDCPQAKALDDILEYIAPDISRIPQLDGIEIAAEIMPHSGTYGGDHIRFIDYRTFDLGSELEAAIKAENMEKADNLRRIHNSIGILLQDGTGHDKTSGILPYGLLQAFMIGMQYELQLYGQPTQDLLDKLHTRFYNTLVGNPKDIESLPKMITAIYGEISADAGFKYYSMAHPEPLTFSYEHETIGKVGSQSASTPLGLRPSKKRPASEDAGPSEHRADYGPNERKLLSPMDLMILSTDGLMEHHDKAGGLYVDNRFRDFLIENKNASAPDIAKNLTQDLRAFAAPGDDISYVIIKRG